MLKAIKLKAESQKPGDGMTGMLVWVFVLLLPAALFSQNNWGVFAGANYSFFTDGFAGQVYAEPDSFGLQAGVNYEHHLNNTASIRPGLVFSQVGDRNRTSAAFGSTTELSMVDLELTYLNIPIDFKFWHKIYIVAGPQIGILIDHKTHNPMFPEPKSKTDFGLNLSGGFRINKFFAEFGVYQGLTTIAQYRYGPTGSMVDVRNAGAKFTLGCHF